MACISFLQSTQKHNQRTFTSTYRRYSVLLNTNEEKKKVSKKQSVEESDDDDDDDDEVISNVGGNNSTDDLSEPDVKWRLEALMIISGMLFILPLELISILF